MSWEPELEELRRREELARRMGGEERVGRQHSSGRLTVRGGAADAAIWEKAVYAERMAHDLRLPLVRLVDGTGGGGSVKSLEQMGFSYVPPLPGFDLVVESLSIVPVATAALGPVAGLGAARGSAAGPWACSPPIRTTMAGASPRTRPRRPPASWTPATSSTSPS